MNRDIKFRAWDSENKKMYYPFDFSELPNINETMDCGSPLFYEIKDGDFNDFEPLQYIGIKAKNKDVYEGDIIAVNGKYPKIVRRSKSGFNFCLVNISDLQYENTMDIEQFPDKKWLEDYKDELEIIGNIFENPELLNDK